MWFKRAPNKWELVWLIAYTVNWLDSNGRKTGDYSQVMYYLEQDQCGNRRARHKVIGYSPHLVRPKEDTPFPFKVADYWVLTGDESQLVKHNDRCPDVYKRCANPSVEADARALLRDVRAMLPLLDSPAVKREMKGWSEWAKQEMEHAQGV